MLFKAIGLMAVCLGILLPGSAFAEVTIDGNPNEAEWNTAQRFDQFVVIDPLTLETPRHETEVKVLSLPEGLAVAFICDQPEETRTRTQTTRDAMRFDSDSVSLMIDFDGTGKTAYEFSVSITGGYKDGTITDESKFNYDWDGVWQRAIREDPDRWTVEILLPWSIVAMQDGDGDTRKMGVSLQRILYSKNEKYACPDASPDRGMFISKFAPVEVARYSVREFNIWPYATVLSDMVNNEVSTKAGVDLFWKQNGKLQVAATLNPDFGQVESDDLVINFSAIETFYTEKRPFFTENQSIFNLGMPKQGSLFYTRRIGGASDEDRTASNIDGALKVIGSSGFLDYGLFGAKEADDEGRSFYAGRLRLPRGNYSIGLLSTFVDRPFLDRTGMVNSFDYEVNLSEALRMQGKVFSSNIDSPLKESQGYGVYSSLQYNPSERWSYQGVLTRYDDSLDISDMGYVQRTNIEEAYLSGQWRKTDFSEGSRLASISWKLLSILGRNTDGDILPATVTVSRTAKLKSGSDILTEIGMEVAGYDDMISRGHGLVYLDNRWKGTLSYTAPRRNAWRTVLALKVFQEGYNDWGMGIEGNATWYPHDTLTVDFSVKPRWSRDWLIWTRDDLLAGYSRRQIDGNILATWFPADKHELRLRTQWVTINADLEQEYRIGSKGKLVPVMDGQADDFATTNFGLQLRYRYEIAALSDFYIVYSRGGIDRIDDPEESTLELFGRSTDLRDSDQLLVKLRYRF